MAELTEDLVKQISLDAVSAYIKDSGMDKTDQKFLVIPGIDEKEQLAKSKKERFGEVAKAIMNKDIVQAVNITKTADPNNITTDADGGYLVPDETAAEIITLMPTYGQARSLCDVGVFPKNRDLYNIPKDGTSIGVYYPGEQGSITTSKAIISTIQLQAKKAAGMVVLTDELKEFAIVDFVSYLNRKAAQAFATDEDSKVFGKVNTVFTGLFYATQLFGKEVSVASTSDVTYNKLLEVVYGIDQNYLAGASWLMHRTMVEKVRGIVDDNNLPIFVPANAGGLATLMGYPVRMIENGIPTSAETTSGQPIMMLGNLKNSYIKDKMGFTVDVSNDATVDATNLFQYDLSAIRFKRHWAFHPGLVEKYGVIQLS